jgi:putative tricarboxylic transport membrane protein
MKLHDSVLAAAMLALAIAVVMAAQRFPPAPGQPVGPGLFPTVIGVALGLSAIALFFRSLAAHGPRSWVAAAPALLRPRGVAGFLLAPGAVLFYLAFSESVGFIPCSILILATLFTAYGVRLRIGLPLALMMTGVIYAVFGRLLSVPLPRGILDAYL